MTERTGKDLADMIGRIPNDVLGREIKKYFMQVTGIQEARDLMEQFLEFHIRQPKA